MLIVLADYLFSKTEKDCDFETHFVPILVNWKDGKKVHSQQSLDSTSSAHFTNNCNKLECNSYKSYGNRMIDRFKAFENIALSNRSDASEYSFARLTPT